MMARDVEVEFEDSEAYRRVKRLLEGSEDWSIECRTSYSGVVEFGAGPAVGNAPFMPPLEPIKEWARRKIPVETRSRRVRDGVFVEERVGHRRMRKDEAEKAAEAIRWKIYNEGLEPQPFARPAIHDLQAGIGGVVDRALREGEAPMHAVMDFIRTRMRHHIGQNGTNDEGTLAREMYIVHPDGRREKCRPSVKAPARRTPWMRPSGGGDNASSPCI